jgi:hypothetical protein
VVKGYYPKKKTKKQAAPPKKMGLAKRVLVKTGEKLYKGLKNTNWEGIARGVGGAPSQPRQQKQPRTRKGQSRRVPAKRQTRRKPAPRKNTYLRELEELFS